MKEYIEREKLRLMKTEECAGHTIEYAMGWKACIDWIKELPAADVRPVVRGKWLTGNDNPRTYGRIRAMCGRCGAFALAEMVNPGSYKERLSNFCPNCGAEMVKGEAE